MNQPDLSREVRLTIPARQEYALVASMTLCGLGMSAGLDMDLLGDLRTVTCECLDCLLHQAGCPEWIEICASVKDGRLCVGFHAVSRQRMQAADTLDLDITAWRFGDADAAGAAGTGWRRRVRHRMLDARLGAEAAMNDEHLIPLLERYAASRDPALRDELFERYLPLARAVARKFSGRGVETEDLEQVAGMALLKALERFESGAGLSLRHLCGAHHHRRRAQLPARQKRPDAHAARYAASAFTR